MVDSVKLNKGNAGLEAADLSPQALYLDLLKRCLTDCLYFADIQPNQDRAQEKEKKKGGLVWPVWAHTMVGMYRLNNLQDLMEAVLQNNIPGDFIETGVWRGGTCIFMRALLKTYQVRDRRVWVADSFQGLPPVDLAQYPQDAPLSHLSDQPFLAIPLEEVQANFKKYHMLDEQVCFLPGWFSESLPKAPIEQLALLRLDGDYYSSTMDGLVHLYPKLSVGGYVIVDDYGLLPCKKAVHDYRELHGIEAPLIRVDQFAVYWQKEASA